MKLPDEKELLAMCPGHAPGEMPLIIHNGRFGVDMLVPANFYELPDDAIWQRYFQPAIEHMKREHESRKDALDTKAS